MTSTLWLVATPIGNLGDLQPRAIDILRTAALVACEDTRRASKLLQHAGIRARRLAVANDHTEFQLIDEVLSVLAGGGDVAVVSDAGSPAVSDPGARLVKAAIDAGYLVSAVPGPAAVIMAVTISGLPSERFAFEGFLPRKGTDRTDRLNALRQEARTMVFYEAPHRIETTITDLAATFGHDRPVAVCRELTKIYEEVIRGTLGSIDLGSARGEYVVVVAGQPVEPAPVSDANIQAALDAELANGLSKRDAVRTVAELTGEPKNRVYDLMNQRARQ